MSILVVVLLLLVQGCAGAVRETLPPGAPAPPAEATLIVDPGGRAGSDCRPATPCTTIARAAELVQAGDVVVIRPGTYGGDIVVRGAGTAQRPIVFAAERPGTVIVNGHIRPAGWQGDSGGGFTANPYVTWRGLIVRNAGDGNGSTATCDGGNYAFRASLGWRIENSVVERGQSGVRVSGNNIVIEGTTFQDLARYAWIGGRVSGVVMRNNIIRRINTAGTINPPCGAVTKLLFTDGTILEGNQSYENVGPGLWLDWDNKNYIIRNNVLRNNRGRSASWEGPGLWIEGNPASNGKVYGNTFADNTGAGIGILESVGVEVYDNTFIGNTPGIELRNILRGAERVLRNINVHDNTFNSWRSAAVSTSAGTWTGWSASSHNIVFDRNTYTPEPGAVLFRWLGRNYTSLGEVRSALRFEASGEVIAP